MTHSLAYPPRSLTWTRQGSRWHLSSGGLLLAFIERDLSRWLCYTSEDCGDDGLLGPMPTLAAAKAYFEHRASYVVSPCGALDERPL
jgi:hypothetical protein